VGAGVPQLATKFAAQNILINYYGTKHSTNRQAHRRRAHNNNVCFPYY